MGIIAFILLPFRVLSIFTGFTFTDIEDYGPLLTLVVGIVALATMRRQNQKSATLPLMLVMVLLAFGPLLPNLGIYFLATEFQSIYGSWPEPMVDDSHRSGNISVLYSPVSYLEAFSGAWMVLFVAYCCTLNNRFSERQSKLILGTMFLSLFVVLLDPGKLYTWWLD